MVSDSAHPASQREPVGPQFERTTLPLGWVSDIWDVVPLHSPLLGQSQLLSLPVPTDMLKLGTFLHAPPGRDHCSIGQEGCVLHSANNVPPGSCNNRWPSTAPRILPPGTSPQDQPIINWTTTKASNVVAEPLAREAQQTHHLSGYLLLRRGSKV